MKSVRAAFRPTVGTTVISTFVLTLALTLTPTVASSHDDKDPRHIAMSTLGKNMKTIKRATKAGEITPDLQKRASEIQEISTRLVALFPAGQQAADSRAKPEIWSDMAGFKKANDKFIVAAAALVKAVGSGDPAAVGAALKGTGKTCGGCHKPYRLPKK